jgi:hypothetical protein
MLIRTSLTAETCFLLMLLTGQWLVLLGSDPLTVFAILIAVRAVLILIAVYDARCRSSPPT